MAGPNSRTRRCSTAPPRWTESCCHKITLLIEAARRQRDGIEFTGVVFAHQLRVSIAEAVEGLQVLAEAGQPDDFRNQVFHLPL